MAAIDEILGGGYSQPTATKPPEHLRVSVPQQQTSATDNDWANGTPYIVHGVSGKPVVIGGTPSRDMSYVEMFQMLNPERPETAEEKAKREKREKGEAMLAAVGDGISALSNLWFTSQYAPNAYDPSKGMSATTKNRWDKLRQLRDANRRDYYNGYIQARSMDDAKDRDDRNWRHSLEREKIADERYEVEEERDKELHEDRAREQKAKADRAEHDAARAKVQAENEAERLTSIINKNNRMGLSGGRQGNKYVLHTPDGSKTYATAAEYNAAVYKYAEKYDLANTRHLSTGNGERQVMVSTAEMAGAIQNIPKGTPAKKAGPAKADYSQYEIKSYNEDFSQYEKK